MRKTGSLIALLAAALTACGGGGSADDAFKGDGSGSGGTGGTGGGTGGTQSVQLGSGTGSAFQPGAIAISSGTVSAGGSTSLSVSLVQTDGSLYTQQSSVVFNSPCVAAGTAAIQPDATATTTNGVATVTYVAKGCAGTDAITATTTSGGVARTATGSVTVAPAAIGSIAFISATPTNIALKGTGDAGRPESSTVIFRVLDAAGGPRSGATVAFSLNTTVGGISLQGTNPATSDAQGNVQIVVNGGTVATSVKVTATVQNTTPQIATQSSQLTVTTGIPTAGAFSIATQCTNVEGWDYDGTINEVTVRLADRFQNPAPDGTAVTFTAEGGAILPQCTTTTNATESGLCSVNWRSQLPRPADGRVTILAKAIGEESFVDANGNGSFDATENFSDLGEPYRDDDESGTYTAGVDGDFFDFNNNQALNVADGLFNGVLCNDSARCGGTATRSTGIGAQHLIILSGSAATISDIGGAPHSQPYIVGLKASRTISFWVRDDRGNAMPGTTEITAEITGSGVTLGNPTTQMVPCVGSAVGAGTVFDFTLIGGETAGSGLLTLSVKTPKGTVRTYSVSVAAQ